jgi:excisionase family DNA binding protein
MSRQMTIKEAAEMLGVSDKTVRRRIKKGELPAELVDSPYGEQYMIPADAVEAASQTIAVATVEKQPDPRTIAMAIGQALDQRDAEIKSEIQALRDEIKQRDEQITATLEKLESYEVDRQHREEERDKELITKMRKAMEIKKQEKQNRSLWQRLKDWANEEW